MKIRNAGLFLSALLLAGCWQKSLNPFYTAADLTSDPKLVGSWFDAENKDEDRTIWTFTEAGENQYSLSISNKEGNHKLHARFFNLGGKRFMDLAPGEESVATVAAHHLFLVPYIAPDLKLAALDLEWMAKWLKAHPESLAHVRVVDPCDKDKEELVLTADTKALQTFVKLHLVDEGFFSDPTVLKKINAAADKPAK